MGPCAIPIASRILKLHQNLHNNMLYWNPKGFFDISIVKKMTVTSKPLKRPQNGQFWEFDNFFGGQKNFLGQKFFLEYIPHYNENFSIKLNFWNCNLHIFGILRVRGPWGNPGGQKWNFFSLFPDEVGFYTHIMNFNYLGQLEVSFPGGGVKDPPPMVHEYKIYRMVHKGLK